MARTGLALLAVAGTFLLAAGAQAKAPPDGIDVCGAGGACAHLAWGDAEQFWIRTHESGGADRAAPGPFYLLRWHWTPGVEESAYLVPGALAVRWNSGDGHPAAWSGIDRSAVDLARRAAAAIEPYATPTLTRVTVGGRAVREPQTYLRILSGKPSWAWITGRWLRVTFESASPSPWTDGSSIVRLSRTKPYVSIDGWFYKLPKDVAARARRGLALRG
jgi:hypothetical protein